MSYAPPKPPSESRNLVSVLLIVGVVLLCCVGVPVVSGLGAAMYLGMQASREAQTTFESIDEMAGPRMPAMPGMPTMPGEPPFPGRPDGEIANKLALQQAMQIAEQQYRMAQLQYETAQRVYEQQRDFALQQGGRLGAQGIQIPQPQLDPTLAQQVEAARIQYENAKAAFEAAQ